MPITKITKLDEKQKNHSDKELSNVQLSKGKKNSKKLSLRKILEELHKQYISNLQSWCSQITSYKKKA